MSDNRELDPWLGGSLHKVDCESLNTLVHEYDQELDKNFAKKAEFIKFKDDYLKLKSRLKTLPEQLEYGAMVPIASKALCPGKIIHTNEILVLLGENTFVECTAKKAAEIVTHRIKSIDDTLNRLEKERELFNSWKVEAERQMVETLGEGTTEIMEEYDEEKEKEWKLRHRENVRKYHQELAKERQKEASSQPVNNVGNTKEVEKLWTRLDALELEEEFMEAQAIYEERLSDSGPLTSVVSNDKCTAKIRERSKLNFVEGFPPPDNRDVENASNQASGKKVTFSPENIIHNLTDLNKDSKKKSKDTDASEQKEEVELYIPSETCENGLLDPIFIRFRHEISCTDSPDDENDLVSSDSDSDDDPNYQIVLSPGDIYDQFGPPSLEAKMSTVPGSDKAPLKSILKPRAKGNHHSHSDLSHNIEAPSAKKINNDAPVKKPLCETPSVISAISAQVIERVVVPNNRTNSFPGETNSTVGVTTNNSKPMSLFKKMKAIGGGGGDRTLSAEDANN